jgi:hypothetical protein
LKKKKRRNLSNPTQSRRPINFRPTRPKTPRPSLPPLSFSLSDGRDPLVMGPTRQPRPLPPAGRPPWPRRPSSRASPIKTSPSRASKARPSCPPSITYRFSSIKTPPPLNALKTGAMAIDGHHFGRRPSSPPCPIRAHPRASVAALFTHPRLPYPLPTSTGAARSRAAAAAINGRPASTRHRLGRPFPSPAYAL